jgi:hypothetical protein
LSCFTEEVKIFANRVLLAFVSFAKCVCVEFIVVLFQLVTKAVVGVFKINALNVVSYFPMWRK